jgi:hypothetical protein
MRSSTLSLSLCAVALSAPFLRPVPGHLGSAAPPLPLRIESVTEQSVPVSVRSTPPGLWLDSAAADLKGGLVVHTPAVVHVADSVRTVDLRVLGRGAVRVRFPGRSSRQEERLVPWGGEITLSRTADGFLSPVWKVRPLP